MNKISKLFCTGLALLSQSMFLAFGASNIDEPQTKEYIEQSVISSEKDHKEESLAGTYVGSYTDNGQTHGVSLEIVEANGVNYATFSFYPLSYSKSKASGSFFMNVEKNEDGTYNFIQDEWVSRPGHYEMVDLLNCTLSDSSITGGVFAQSGNLQIQIGNLFVTTIDELYGVYKGSYHTGLLRTAFEITLTITKNRGIPQAYFYSTTQDKTEIESYALNIVPFGVRGNYNFDAIKENAYLPKWFVVGHILSCSLHNNILTGIISDVRGGYGNDSSSSLEPVALRKIS